MSDQTPQVNNTEEELSIEELDEAAGGTFSNADLEAANANACAGGNCGCTANP